MPAARQSIEARMNASGTAILQRLEAILQEQGALALAVSGGVDSMTLAVVACRLHPATTVFHAISPAVPAFATARVRQYASDHGWKLTCINAGEMNDPNYRANPANRCYFCKGNLYRSLRAHTALPIAAGTNLDDLQDYRPGLLAASEQQILHPLVDASISKEGVRALAASLGLADLEDLPASPCLSSRITTGIAIDADLLRLIDRTEEALRCLLKLHGANADLRCRIHGNGITVELPLQHDAVQAARIKDTVQAVFHATRFGHYCQKIAIAPYKKGSAFVRTDKLQVRQPKPDHGEMAG